MTTDIELEGLRARLADLQAKRAARSELEKVAADPGPARRVLAEQMSGLVGQLWGASGDELDHAARLVEQLRRVLGDNHEAARIQRHSSGRSDGGEVTPIGSARVSRASRGHREDASGRLGGLRG